MNDRQQQLARAALLDHVLENYAQLTLAQLAQLERAYRDPTPELARAAVERLRDKLRAQADELDVLSKETTIDGS